MPPSDAGDGVLACGGDCLGTVWIYDHRPSRASLVISKVAARRLESWHGSTRAGIWTYPSLLRLLSRWVGQVEQAGLTSAVEAMVGIIASEDADTSDGGGGTAETALGLAEYVAERIEGCG